MGHRSQTKSGELPSFSYREPWFLHAAIGRRLRSRRLSTSERSHKGEAIGRHGELSDPKTASTLGNGGKMAALLPFDAKQAALLTPVIAQATDSQQGKRET